jgi:hypothetical protein
MESGHLACKLSYHDGNAGRFRERKVFVSVLPGFGCKSSEESRLPLRALGWASVAVGVAALGLYVGRELRIRYKFKRRTPSDFYSHAGDEYPSADYGVGI